MEPIRLKVILLYLLLPILIAGHNIHDFAPLFYGVSVAVEQADAAPASALWLTAFLFLGPGAAVLLAIISEALAVRIFALGLGVVLLAMNGFHLYGHISDPTSPESTIAALMLIFVTALTLCLMSLAWVRKPSAG